MSNHLKEKRDRNGEIINQYVDGVDRYMVADALYQIDNVNLISGGKYDIDLFDENNDKRLYEVENNKCYGDYKKAPKSDRFHRGHKTVNYSERKFGYFGYLTTHSKWLEKNEKIDFYKNFIIDFVRTNKYYNQIYIIRHHILIDPKNAVRIYNQIVDNSELEEDFMTYHIDLCEEYHLQSSGLWVRSTEINGDYDDSTKITQLEKAKKYNQDRIKKALQQHKNN